MLSLPVPVKIFNAYDRCENETADRRRAFCQSSSTVGVEEGCENGVGRRCG